MKEREIIIGVLHDLARRLWIARVIREAAFFACVVAFCLVCYQLVEPAVVSAIPSVGTAMHAALLAAFAAVTLEFARRSARRISPREAAAQADARAHLKDELKSAHWFLSEAPLSPFAELQVRRAAATAAGLDLAVVAPRSPPRNAWLAAALGLAIAALTWMTPQMSRPWSAGRDAVAEEQRESPDLRSLLADAPADAQIAKLDLALRTLQQAGATPEEKTRALAEARDAIDQANMEASAAREEMAKLAGSLKADEKFESAAQAMSEGRMDDAMALLHKLKAGSGAATRETQDVQPNAKAVSPESNASEPVESAGRDLAGKNAAVNQDAINRVIKKLEEANERVEVQNRVNNVKRRLDSLVATSQRSQLTASQFDNRTNSPNPTPAPTTGNADIRGGALFRQAAVAREDNDDAREGSQTGDASGDSAALPLEGVATRRLDAQLKRETIAQKYDAGEEAQGKGDAGWFYSASREQKSVLQAEDVRSGATYEREDAGDHDRVPLRQKTIVKNYFLNLHESEKK
jgi:hypothetical protein